MTRPDFEVIVLAGGSATRLERFPSTPKCLMPFRSAPVLKSLLDELRSLNLKVLVSTNRLDYLGQVSEICDESGAVLTTDPGFDSTIDVARMNAHQMSESFCFIYGHTWLPAFELHKFFTGGEAVGVYSSSSRRDAIPTQGGFIEPPFRVSRSHFSASDARSWREYWTTVGSAADGHLIHGPHEANTQAEILAYEEQWRRALAA